KIPDVVSEWPAAASRAGHRVRDGIKLVAGASVTLYKQDDFDEGQTHDTCPDRRRPAAGPRLGVLVGVRDRACPRARPSGCGLGAGPLSWLALGAWPLGLTTWAWRLPAGS